MTWTTSAKLAVLAALAAGLTGCQQLIPRAPLPPQEQFSSTTTFSRTFGTPPADTCEAARRALLSQGYVMMIASKDLAHGRKNFQPNSDTHVELEIRVVCASETRKGTTTLAFVTAQQDRFTLKKSNNSASVGVGAVGSVSLPFSSSDDSLVRISSETITSEAFYEKLFQLVHRFLLDDDEEEDQHDGGGRKDAPGDAKGPAKKP